MMRFLEYFATFSLLVILQEFVFDNINLGGLVTPYVYIMFIIMLPMNISGWFLLLLGFGTGAMVDFMSGTAGVQTIVATWLAFVRPTVVNMFLGKDMAYEGGIPTAGRVSNARFIRYIAVMVVLFNIPFFILEELSTNVLIVALRIVLSSLFSVVIMYFLHLPFVNVKLKM